VAALGRTSVESWALRIALVFAAVADSGGAARAAFPAGSTLRDGPRTEAVAGGDWAFVRRRAFIATALVVLPTAHFVVAGCALAADVPGPAKPNPLAPPQTVAAQSSASTAASFSGDI
jgi:hypothetical protein